MALSKVDPNFLNVSQVGGRRNLIINGAMQVWQRGNANASVSANTYPAADRWKFWVGGAATTTAQVSFGVGQTDVPNFQYFNRITVGSNSGAGDYSTFNQHIENVTLFENRQVTLSFYAKASTAWTVGIESIQNFGTGGSPSSRVLITPVTVNVGTTWERHSVTITLPSISGKALGTDTHTSNFELAFWLTGGSDFNSRTGSIGNQSGTFEITGVQLEFGDTATPFEHRSHGEEIALCKRYFQKLSYLPGLSYSSTTITCVANYSTMRVTPTFSASGALNFQGTAANNSTQSSASVGTPYTSFENGDRCSTYFTSVGGFSSLTASQPGYLAIPVNNSQYINADAEI